MEIAPVLITVIAGLAVLFFGRQLFWLFVGIAGFAASFELATQYLSSQPAWLILLIAILVGILGAVIAVFLQYVAVGIGGFLAGGYATLVLLRLFDAAGSGYLLWTLIIIGGVIGAALLLLVFDWALIILSSATGAAMLAPLVDLAPSLQTVLFIVLLVIGIAVQAYMMRGEDVTTRRTIIRRRTS